MLRLVLVIMVVGVFSGCIFDGKAGSDGQDGSDHHQFVSTGVLYAADETAATATVSAYWDKTIYSINDSSLVSVYVRQGSGYMWQTPTWYLGSSYIRIIDDALTNSAYEYKVVVGN